MMAVSMISEKQSKIIINQNQINRKGNNVRLPEQ